MRVLLAAAEAMPYFKTGGLADVARSLPDALYARGIDVRIIMPHYPTVQLRGGSTGHEPDLLVPWVGGAVSARCTLHHAGPQRAPALLLEQPGFFATSDPYGGPWDDEAVLARRFAFFARAAVAYAARWDADVIHLNDWQTGLAPCYALLDGWAGATVFAVHNLPYQGNFSPQVLPEIGIPPELFRTENGLEYHGHASFMKSGLALADRLVTVSPTYAREIQTPRFGAGFDGLLRFRHRVLHGILNGINPQQWNPATDTALPHNYHADDLAAKDLNRSSLLAELDLDDGGPLVVMATRLAHQKGLDLLLAALPDILATDVRVAVLGDGNGRYGPALADWQGRAPRRFAVRLAFDDELARRFYSGGDFFLMPSLYEPCGLGQMIAQRYGTPPIVRRTGGLADTVEDGRTGFTFDFEAPDSLRDAVFRARSAWRAAGWTSMRKRCMHLDRSWPRSARLYEQVYQLAVGRISA